MKPLGNFHCDDSPLRLFGRTDTGHSHLGKMHCGSFIMIEYAKTWLDLKLDRRAVTALEYGLIAGVIVAVITLGFTTLANSLSTKFSGIGTSL
jgi:pilus assembly protein Flp/PilA